MPSDNVPHYGISAQAQQFLDIMYIPIIAVISGWAVLEKLRKGRRLMGFDKHLDYTEAADLGPPVRGSNTGNHRLWLTLQYAGPSLCVSVVRVSQHVRALTAANYLTQSLCSFPTELLGALVSAERGKLEGFCSRGHRCLPLGPSLSWLTQCLLQLRMWMLRLRRRGSSGQFSMRGGCVLSLWYTQARLED